MSFLTLVTVPLVMFTMTEEAKYAARKYLYFLSEARRLHSSALSLSSYTVRRTRSAGRRIDASGIGNARLLQIVYLLTFCGFGVKAAVFPIHSWLPEAAVAPTPVTALLHAVAVVKSGVFAIARVTYFSFGAAFLRGTWAQYAAIAIALVTILYGSSVAVRERHFKRRLAWSTVANLSYILFGVLLLSPAGLASGMMHMLFHAFMKITLFYCAGAVLYKTEREYLSELDGLGRRMPVTFTCYTVSALALTGIPPFPGFIQVRAWNGRCYGRRRMGHGWRGRSAGIGAAHGNLRAVPGSACVPAAEGFPAASRRHPRPQLVHAGADHTDLRGDGTVRYVLRRNL